MNTLIELYDERAIENILAPDMFRPRRIVYLCPGEVIRDRRRQETLAAFFRCRGWEPELIFVEASLFKADRILRQLCAIGEKYPDCAIDVTGGSDAALFAAGMFAARKGVPAFTYSRKKNRFYDISGAAFADELQCDLTYSIEEFFLMAGGTLLPGRVDNHILAQYLPDFDRFFQCFLRFRREWPDIISYIQRVSPSEYGQTPPLSVQAGYDLAARDGAARLMLLCRAYMGNCYCNRRDIERMRPHYAAARRLAQALGEQELLDSIAYNTAAVQIERGQFEEAYGYFSALNDPGVLALHKLAICCEKTGRTAEAYAALERAEAVETAEQRSEAVEKMLAVVRFRLAHPDYLHCDAYGALLLDCFACCRTRLPQGYAAFHLPWVVEWYTAARQYKKVCELLTEFPDIRL